MKLTILGSSSKGNCYVLQNDTEALVLELGVAFKQVKEALDFNLNKVVGVLVTHNHGDHAKYVSHALRDSLTIHMSKGCHEALSIENNKIKHIKHMQKVRLGNFDVIAFNVNHDAPEPLGFIINHPETGRVCFITDSAFIDYTFPGINNFIVEANYCDKIIEQNIKSGKLHPSRFARTKYSHMSINTCYDFLKANDLSKVNNILLIHLSPENSDADRFKTDIEQLTGKTVTVAKKGIEMDFNATPFFSL